jgi:hypothetical protein
MSNNVIKITLMKTFKKFYFLPKGAVYAYDVYATSERKARKRIREFMGVKTLHSVQVWDSGEVLKTYS